MNVRPLHINVHQEDLVGNGSIGRYLFLTGSDDRAQKIAEHFTGVKISKHPRQHHFYSGDLLIGGSSIAVAAISTGMGGPSIDIIVNELIALGAKRFLRVGTAGSLQPQKVKVGDVVIATAAVRDDKASWDYIYPEYPAIPSIEYLTASIHALRNLKIAAHFGIVHSKSSFYARECHYTFCEENKHYMQNLKAAGVLASEMETAQLFTLSTLFSARFAKLNSHSLPILSGSILAIVGDEEPICGDQKKVDQAINNALSLAFETTKALFILEKP